MPDSPDPAPASPFPWDRPRSVLLIAIWFGLVTGGIEALVLLLFALLDRCALDSYSPIIWTIPFTDAAFLTLPGLIFFFCAPKGVSPRLRKFALFFFCTVAVSATIFAVCSTMTVMLFPPAVILLAAGIA